MNIDPRSRDFLVRTVVGEAAGEPLDGQTAVAAVVLNRAKAGRYGGNTIRKVVLAPGQFEPWGTRRSELLGYAEDDPAYLEASSAVDRALDGDDPTGGSTHFLNPDTVRDRRGGSLPKWASGQGLQIGRHAFYAPEGKVGGGGDAAGKRVTDPDLIRKLDGLSERPSNGATAGRKVTDPDLIARLEAAANAPSADDRIAGAFETAATANPVSQGRSFLEGVGDSASVGFGDEIGAALSLPVSSLLSGDVGPTYQRNLAIRRAVQENAQEQNPVSYLGGQVGGSLMTAPLIPGVAPLRAAGWTGRAANAALGGAAYGGAYGAGSAEGGLQDRAEGALEGAELGALTGAVASPAIDIALGAGRGLARGARNVVAPMTSSGREQIAARTLQEAASDPALARAALENVDEVVPGSVPTTFQQSGDMGLGGLERRVRTQNPELFNQRAADQNAARLAALENIQAEGHPEAVASLFRGQLSDLDRFTQATVDDATAAAATRTTRIGGTGGTPDGFGGTLRGGLDEARSAAKVRERALWQAVDPDGSLALPAATVKQTAAGIRKALPAAARGIEGEEAAIFGAVQALPDVAPFSEITALRSRLSTAMREELSTKGQTPVYARLSQLRGAVESDLDAAVSQKAAQEAEAVAAGQLDPMETMSQRLADKRDMWLEARVGQEATRASALGGVGADAGARPAIVSRSSGARGEGGGRPGSAPGDQGLSRDVPLSPNFDEAALERLRTASAATKDRAQTFDIGPIGVILKRSGAQGPFRVADAVVPERIFSPGAKGSASVQAFRQAAGDDQAMMVLQDYAASQLRRAAERADGTLDPAKVTAWRSKHADALRAFPVLDQRFADAARASEGITAAAGVRKATLDAYQKGLVGRLMGVEAPEDVTRIVGSLFQRADGMLDMRRLAQLTRDDPEGRQGLRKAIADFVTGRFVGNTEAATSGSGAMKSDAFQTFIRKNVGALKLVFSDAEVDMMQRIALDLRNANRSINAVKLPGQSNTAQDLIGGKGGSGSILSGIVREAWRHKGSAAAGGAALFTTGLWPALAAVAGTELVGAFRRAGMRKVDDLIVDAMLNPARARALLEKQLPGKPSAASSQIVQLYSRAAVVPIADDTAEATEQAFDPDIRAPKAILTLRRNLERSDPGQWSKLKRDYTSNVIAEAIGSTDVSTMARDAASERGGNAASTPRTLRAALMREPVQANLKAAMTDEEKSRLTSVIVLLGKADALPTPRISMAEMQDQARPLLARIAAKPNPTRAIRSLATWAQTTDSAQHADALSELMFSDDEETKKAISELRRLSPLDSRWGVVFGHLLSRTKAFGAEQSEEAEPAPLPMAVGQ